MVLHANAFLTIVVAIDSNLSIYCGSLPIVLDSSIMVKKVYVTADLYNAHVQD
jgi:hypothetical protein